MTREETRQMFSPKLNAFLGFEAEGAGLVINMTMNPPFEKQIVEQKASSVVMRGRNGIISERFPSDIADSSIPHLDHLVPPDIPYSHYCDYLDKKRELIGK